MMEVRNHGMWKLHQTGDAPEDNLAILYAKRDDGKDWYDYIKSDVFQSRSVKMTCMAMGDEWVVLAATFDADRLFPAGCMVLEVIGFKENNPQKYFGGKQYDPNDESFKVRDDHA